MFVVRDGRVEFVPIKMGIAGDKYFEVLDGPQAGRPGHHRPVQLGPRHGRRRPGEGRDAEGDAERQGGTRPMNKFLEAAGIALDAIWAAKLRSFMTVLGNIVAVTSIIAVVSLIQGLNASVKDAILNQAGADSFSIQQFPVTRSDEEFDKVRCNPRITLARRARDPALQPARIARSWPQSQRHRAGHLSRQVDRQHAGSGRHARSTSTSRPSTPSAAG